MVVDGVFSTVGNTNMDYRSFNINFENNHDKQIKKCGECKKLLKDPSINTVLLDELTYMLSYKYLDLDEVLSAIASRPEGQHVVVTGRAAHRQLVEMADTVSEVQSLKHAFENGVKVQKGIDW